MLIDKGYYDYDFEARKDAGGAAVKPKSGEEVGAMLARFGFNTRIGRGKETQALSPEEAQRMAMEEIRKNGF